MTEKLRDRERKIRDLNETLEELDVKIEAARQKKLSKEFTTTPFGTEHSNDDDDHDDEEDGDDGDDDDDEDNDDDDDDDDDGNSYGFWPSKPVRITIIYVILSFWPSKSMRITIIYVILIASGLPKL